jgi:hypothetical protein
VTAAVADSTVVVVVVADFMAAAAVVVDMADSDFAVEGRVSNATLYQRHNCGLNKGSCRCTPCEPDIQAL